MGVSSGEFCPRAVGSSLVDLRPRVVSTRSPALRLACDSRVVVVVVIVAVEVVVVVVAEVVVVVVVVVAVVVVW